MICSSMILEVGWIWGQEISCASPQPFPRQTDGKGAPLLKWDCYDDPRECWRFCSRVSSEVRLLPASPTGSGFNRLYPYKAGGSR
ncbi:hypothetical protein AFLA_002499 [Aspergillus flavus NRRL3357]|nr:hypothetical protein AFLA_002499 [Aspergillus flavus NRRL3357]